MLVAVSWLELGLAFPLMSPILLEASWMTALAGGFASLIEIRKTGTLQAFGQCLAGLAQMAVLRWRWVLHLYDYLA